ncbi:tigger transposable element-derived protein 4-like [Aphis craccivora]|uniref:Tigger transposable element-derived protein 4-like n=1 Tax=Aphis craccivora TaxID=307492 RepID=A0A6G0VPB6_APHCR|nr:tigger transposable element-derived protein 4-like [Aphis craccivora]
MQLPRHEAWSYYLNLDISYFSRSRHNLIDVCYLAQIYSKVPKQLLRDNANFIVLFKQVEINLKHVYMEHCSGDMSYSEFKDFCTLCWRKGIFEFIVINKDCERDNGRYRYGFFILNRYDLWQADLVEMIGEEYSVAIPTMSKFQRKLPENNNRHYIAITRHVLINIYTRPGKCFQITNMLENRISAFRQKIIANNCDKLRTTLQLLKVVGYLSSIFYDIIVLYEVLNDII